MSGKKSNYRFYQNFKVAGFAFAEGCMVFDKLKPGVKLELEREPNNNFDSYAVAIYYENAKIGYIPKGSNVDICTFLDMGHTDIFDVRVQSINPNTHPEQQVGVVIFVKAKE